MYRAGDIRNNYADVSKAKKLLGFEAKTSFAEGIKNLPSGLILRKQRKIVMRSLYGK